MAFRFKILLAPVIATYAVILSAQGPLDGYMKGKGHLDLAPSFSFMSAKVFEGAQQEQYNIPYNGNLLSLFAAYGITDRFDAVASIPYVFTSNQSGLQDGGLYVKYRILKAEVQGKGRWSVIAGTGVSAPLSDYEPIAAGALGQRAVVVPGKIIVQWDTPWGPFLHLTGGYNWRLDDYSEADLNRVRSTRPDYTPPAVPSYASWLVKAGLPLQGFYADIWCEWQQTNPDDGANFAPGVTDLAQAYGVSYTQVGGTVYFSETGKRGVFLSGGKILRGRNVSRILRLTGGMVFKF